MEKFDGKGDYMLWKEKLLAASGDDGSSGGFRGRSNF